MRALIVIIMASMHLPISGPLPPNGWRGGRPVVAGLILCSALAGCASVPHNGADEMTAPSNERNWKANMALLPYARIRPHYVKVYNIRNCTYLDEDTYVMNYYDKTFDLDNIESVDFVVVPFKDVPSLAHTMLSFGFRGGQYLGVSVEVRLEEGETYSPWGGALRQYEIMYVVADERDLIKLRTELRESDVYIYRGRATQQQARELFVDVMKRVNQLKKKPEFYDTLTNNCTTNIAAHINHLAPGRVPWDPTMLLTGYSDRTAYAMGLLVDYGSFEATRRRARVTDLAHRYANDYRFSQRIRSEQSTSRM